MIPRKPLRGYLNSIDFVQIKHLEASLIKKRHSTIGVSEKIFSEMGRYPLLDQTKIEFSNQNSPSANDS